jgi:hypothetical protein
MSFLTIREEEKAGVDSPPVLGLLKLIQLFAHQLSTEGKPRLENAHNVPNVKTSGMPDYAYPPPEISATYQRLFRQTFGMAEISP